MRLFPGDDIPDLAAFSQEMPSPWLMPRGLSRLHRDRLGGLVARAVRAFDPKIRCIQLRWVEAPYVRDGRIKLPPRVLVWWRSDTFIEDPVKVLREAPKVLHGLHLLDLDRDPGVEALGWLAPLKIRLLHKLTDALLESGIDVDPEPLIDAVNDASARLVSPIDLLDFAERLVEARISGLPQEEARVEAIALVLAARLAPGRVKGSDVQQLVAAMERAARPGTLPPDVHALLLRRGLAEKDPSARPPVLDWFAYPGVAERTGRRLQMQAIASASASASATQPAEPKKEALAESAAGKTGTEAPPRKATGESLQALELRAEAVLEDVRQGGSPRWSESRKGEAAALLQSFVNELARTRGDRIATPLVEREAAVLEIAAQLWEDAEQPEVAAKGWLDAAELCLIGDQIGRALKSSHRAIELIDGRANKSVQARSFKILADASMRSDDLGGAQRAYGSALELYRELGNRLGESSTLLGMGDLAFRNDDLAGAEKSYSGALSLDRAVGDRLDEANALSAIGQLHVRTAHHAAAETAYSEALTVHRAAGDVLGESNVLAAFGELYMRTDRLAKAEASYTEALAKFRAVGDLLGEANTLNAFGKLYMRTARLAEAGAAYAEALKLCRAGGYRFGEADTLRSSGDLALRNGDLSAARQAYDSTLALFPVIGDRLLGTTTQRGLAVVDFLEGRDPTEALQASVTLATAAQDPHGALLSRTFLAAADPTPAAAAALDEIAESFAALGTPWEATLARALARLKAGDAAAAATLLRERPETSLLAQEIAQAAPEEAIKLLLPYVPIA